VQLAIDTADPRPIETQIVDEVRRALALGALEPGAPLPTVRTMAAQLRVNPGAVARAYQVLEQQGVVEMRWGGAPVLSHPAGASEDRAALAKRVAERALREARRHGVSPRELAEALRVAIAAEASGSSADRLIEEPERASERVEGRNPSTADTR
jgi:GntR family transcriptional regulator